MRVLLSYENVLFLEILFLTNFCFSLSFKSDRSSLHLACGKGHSKSVKILLEHRASIEAKDQVFFSVIFIYLCKMGISSGISRSLFIFSNFRTIGLPSIMLVSLVMQRPQRYYWSIEQISKPMTRFSFYNYFG